VNIKRQVLWLQKRNGPKEELKRKLETHNQNEKDKKRAIIIFFIPFQCCCLAFFSLTS
jgi:hypothetical protein